ncbi:MAG: hypothetical protein ABI895_18485 [Deltaproteobacteria bacterium]
MLRRTLNLIYGVAALWFACSIDDRAVQGPDEPQGSGASTSMLRNPSESDSDPMPSDVIDNNGAGGGSGTPGSGTPGSGTPGSGTPGSGTAGSGTPGSGTAGSGTAGGACADGQRRCVDGAPEVCASGAWLPGAACTAPLGFCLARSGACVSCEPGAQRCTGERVEGCSDDGLWQPLGIACTECVPRASDCVGTTARVCSALGAWVGQTCAGGEPICVPSTGTCACTATSCGERELCASSGRCEPLGPDCPATAALGVVDQTLGIVRVRFDPDAGADVLLQNLGGGFVSFAAQGYQLCNGANNCVFLAETQSVTLIGDDSFSLRIPNTLPSGGELAVVFQLPGDPVATEAYVAWGSGAGADSFESVVNASIRLWNTGERIAIEQGDTGFVCVGDASTALSYSSCNP